MRHLLSPIVLIAFGTACQSPRATADADPGPLAAATPAEATAGGSSWSCSPRLALSSVWDFLSKKYDSNGDRRITQSEYDRGDKRFANYDRDGDGSLTAADFPPDTFFNGFSHMMVGRADSDGNDEITIAEWRSFMDQLDPNDDGQATQAEVKAVMGDWAADWPLFLLSFDQDTDGDFDRTDLELTFRDQDFDGDEVLVGRETRGWMPTAERPSNPPPAVGEPAPDFDLPRAADSSESFRLAAAVGTRPVALVFGSYT